MIVGVRGPEHLKLLKLNLWGDFFVTKKVHMYSMKYLGSDRNRLERMKTKKIWFFSKMLDMLWEPSKVKLIYKCRIMQIEMEE